MFPELEEELKRTVAIDRHRKLEEIAGSSAYLPSVMAGTNTYENLALPLRNAFEPTRMANLRRAIGKSVFDEDLYVKLYADFKLLELTFGRSISGWPSLECLKEKEGEDAVRNRSCLFFVLPVELALAGCALLYLPLREAWPIAAAAAGVSSFVIGLNPYTMRHAMHWEDSYLDTPKRADSLMQRIQEEKY